MPIVSLDWAEVIGYHVRTDGTQVLSVRLEWTTMEGDAMEIQRQSQPARAGQTPGQVQVERLACGCVILWTETKDYPGRVGHTGNESVRFCPLHASAPALSEALADLLKAAENSNCDSAACEVARAALRASEPKVGE